jgi:hypothetical protein
MSVIPIGSAEAITCGLLMGGVLQFRKASISGCTTCTLFLQQPVREPDSAQRQPRTVGEVRAAADDGRSDGSAGHERAGSWQRRGGRVVDGRVGAMS